MTERTLTRLRHSIAWMTAWLECLEAKRPVSVIRTEMQLRGLLL